MAERGNLAKESTPKLFALCEEVGDRHCGHVEYWGMAFDDHAAIVSATGRMNGSFRSAESARQRLARIGSQELHLMWV
ncbi:hypothetical protein SACE_5848 [Saccharopolyspora erythraea NRRL 2338]|uniref:Uncharacterized protein n=2 Tax=Saccharopolyspora erythraea TaxID=1836 RepID=A4FLV7_SACEN|nr:hypothetical protein JQX30_29300 [Saccharopolyspora erythraea]CAM05032.1 hypothetical protein SACE_5848 [Saccharopolyspora erythraea NRRL 2338]